MVCTDRRTFYDGIDVAKAVMPAVSRGLPPAIGAAAVRQQLLPLIDLYVSEVCVGALPRRGLGALTGSCVAGALGRHILRGLAEHLVASRAHAALTTFEDPPMLLASYTDSLVIIGADASVAESTYGIASECLCAAWRLGSASRRAVGS